MRWNYHTVTCGLHKIDIKRQDYAKMSTSNNWMTFIKIDWIVNV
jgi:hypothetical protein